MKGVMAGGDLPWKVVTLVRPSNQHKQGLWSLFPLARGILGGLEVYSYPFSE